MVVGCIDYSGSIRAKVLIRDENDCDQHGPEYSIGKRWRWSIYAQKFQSTLDQLKGMEGMTKEERFLVKDWLTRRGYRDDPEGQN